MEAIQVKVPLTRSPQSPIMLEIQAKKKYKSKCCKKYKKGKQCSRCPKLKACHLPKAFREVEFKV